MISANYLPGVGTTDEIDCAILVKDDLDLGLECRSELTVQDRHFVSASILGDFLCFVPAGDWRLRRRNRREQSSRE